jgi:hypothetical protein
MPCYDFSTVMSIVALTVIFVILVVVLIRMQEEKIGGSFPSQ